MTFGKSSDKMKFINIHIPKCAGTTFTSILRANFKESFLDGRSVLSDRTFKYSASQVSEILSQFPNCQCLSDHKLSLRLPWDSQNLKVIAFVRNPVERFLSHYYYCRKQSETCFDLEAKQLDLEQYTEEVLFRNPKQDLKNGQCYHLFGREGEFDFGFLKRLIEQNLLMLIPLERFKDACILLEKQYPEYFKDCSFVKMNTTRRNLRHTDNQKLNQKILSSMEKDKELYQLARESFNVRFDDSPWISEYPYLIEQFDYRCSNLIELSNRLTYKLRKRLSQKIFPSSRLSYFE
ncbi:MAG: sulfotransferase family 2 domain-containing protein [Puniceicoccaceae bacterium]